jgi:acyl-CoA synthetase (AMP-forming)/AMP-acid ligase II
MSLYHKMTFGWNQPNKVAIIFKEEEVTFGVLQRRIQKISLFLEEKGCRHGDIIGIQLSKSPVFLEIILAALYMGIGIVPLNDTYTESEVMFYATDAEIKMMISEIKYNDLNCILIDDLELSLKSQIIEFQDKKYNVKESDLAILLYTSGTTGKPKGAYLTHKNLWANIEGLHSAWHWSEDDILLHMLPLFHVHGLFVAAFGALRAQATIILERKFQVERFFECIPKYKCSIFMGVPTMYHRIISDNRSEFDFQTIRLFTSGSAPLAVDIHKKFKQRFAISILERYGMSEVGIVLSNPYKGEKRIGSVGIPICEIECRIIDAVGKDVSEGEIGELLHRGPSVISKYFRRPEESKKSIQTGWLYSGDLAYRDKEGYFYIVGRSKDLIISGGFNVYPREIESVIRKFEGILDVAVIGIPNSEWGESVSAIVICKEEGIDEEDLRKFVSQKCSKYKRPRHYFFVQDFPRNAMGKVQKAKMRYEFASQVKKLR